MDNRFAVYRKIRHDRTYRTIGKMGPWRIVLGTVLMIYVLLLSGFVSQRLAGAGHFRTAEKLMISPAWMEKYKPETKAFIEAGVLYQDGYYEKAIEAFSVIDDVDAADSMKNLTQLKLANQFAESNDYDSAYKQLVDIELTYLADEYIPEYTELCNLLLSFYGSSAANDDLLKCEKIKSLLDNCTDE